VHQVPVGYEPVGWLPTCKNKIQERTRIYNTFVTTKHSWHNRRLETMILSNRPVNILLIEDSAIDSVIFKLLIKRSLGNPVIETCSNGVAAIDRLTQLHSQNKELMPDYIFLDLTMPVMDGWEFMDEYHRLNIDPMHKTKIYVLSSSICKTDISKSLANPRIENFLSKPFDFGKIKSVFFSN
jgi:CheY-like chemotaxis protein